MADTQTRPVFNRTSLLIGLVIGLALGIGVTMLAGRLAPKPSPWVEAGTGWTRLPAQADAGPLPQTFVLPAKAYDYGAISKPLGPLLQAQPSILRIELQVAGGQAGVSLATPDGQRIVSPERAVKPAQGPTSLYFALTPGQGPAAILLRNYGAEGVTGSVTVNAVAYAREADLTAEEIGAINKAG